MNKFARTIGGKITLTAIWILSSIGCIISCALGFMFVELNIYGDEASAKNVLVSFFYKKNISAEPGLVFGRQLADICYRIRFLVYYLAFFLFAAAIVSFILLIVNAGKKKNGEVIELTRVYKVPLEIWLLGFAAAFGITCVLIIDMLESVDSRWKMFALLELAEQVQMVAFAVIATVMITLIMVSFIALCMNIVARKRMHILAKNTIVYKAIAVLSKIFKVLYKWLKATCLKIKELIIGLNLIWHSVIIVAAYSLLQLIVIVLCRRAAPILVCWLIGKIIFVPVFLYFVLMLKRLQIAGEQMAAGDFNYHTDTQYMYLDIKKHADNLNSIADGMSIAVENKLKSERMKTELITNVSHDIKTPITSIINYANLIIDNIDDSEKVGEYSEVLIRQSEKLRRLTDDLVEAAKASSGNLEIELTPCNPTIFLTQAAGEYEEKFASANLHLITNAEGEACTIMADGRRMWRIFDNLMNNAYKYALPGSRIYLTLHSGTDFVEFVFKNISRDELNISADELMERFVRGDSSRNTEGNGLGLSIARSLCELQGGELSLIIDGDLFKVILKFPVNKTD